MKTLILLTMLAADDVPSWLREVSTTKTAEFGPKVPAVVLLNEERTAVDETGKRTTTSAWP